MQYQILARTPETWGTTIVLVFSHPELKFKELKKLFHLQDVLHLKSHFTTFFAEQSLMCCIKYSNATIQCIFSFDFSGQKNYIFNYHFKICTEVDQVFICYETVNSYNFNTNLHCRTLQTWYYIHNTNYFHRQY